MVDYIVGLALKARARVGRGYYDNVRRGGHSSKRLTETIKKVQGTPIITEVKFASPSAGKIREHGDPIRIAKAMLKGGACAISVRTEPDNFQGNFDTLATMSRELNFPLIMKDIIVSPIQIRDTTKPSEPTIHDM